MKLTEEQLEDIIIAYENLDTACTNAMRAGCLDIDGPLYDRMWRGFDDILSIIDPHGWVTWYINDNPTPTDVTDKSSAGHDPSWANSNRPTLWEA